MSPQLIRVTGKEMEKLRRFRGTKRAFLEHIRQMTHQYIHAMTHAFGFVPFVKTIFKCFSDDFAVYLDIIIQNDIQLLMMISYSYQVLKETLTEAYEDIHTVSINNVNANLERFKENSAEFFEVYPHHPRRRYNHAVKRAEDRRRQLTFKLENTFTKLIYHMDEQYKALIKTCSLAFIDGNHVSLGVISMLETGQVYLFERVNELPPATSFDPALLARHPEFAARLKAVDEEKAKIKAEERALRRFCRNVRKMPFKEIAKFNNDKF